MSISNLSAQYISESFQSLVQIDTTNGNIYDGLGAQINNVNTLASSASYSVTANAVNRLNQAVLITGSLSVTGSLSLTGPLIQKSAALTSPLISGSVEYDGTTFYRTGDSNGRTLNANHHFFYQPTAIVHTAAANTDVDVFSGSLNGFDMAPNSLYEVQYNVFYTKTGAGIITWRIDGGTQTWQNAHIQMELSTIAGTGVVTGSNNPTAGGAPIYITLLNATNRQFATLSSTAATEPTNTAHRVFIKALIYTNATTVSNLKLEHQYSAGTSTIYAGSYYTIKRLPTTSVGVFTE